MSRKGRLNRLPSNVVLSRGVSLCDCICAGIGMYLRRSRPESMHPHKAPQRPLQQNTISVHSNMSASSSSVDRSATGASVSVMEPYTPPAESVILLMKRLYWDRIIAGEKTLEIREQRLRSKRYLVGRGGELWGTLVVGPVSVIRTDEEWRALLPLHCWHVDKRPYKKTYALMLCKIESFTTSIGYAIRRGASSITKYRAPDCGKQAGVSARFGWRPDDMRALPQRSQTEESSNETSAKRKRFQRTSI